MRWQKLSWTWRYRIRPYLRRRKYSEDTREWWFAWFPVPVGNRTVWLERVFRQGSKYGWEYAVRD